MGQVYLAVIQSPISINIKNTYILLILISEKYKRHPSRWKTHHAFAILVFVVLSVYAETFEYFLMYHEIMLIVVEM